MSGKKKARTGGAWTKDDEVRDALLDGIARGLRDLDLKLGAQRAEAHYGIEPRSARLEFVDVALLGADGAAIVVAPISAVLAWISGRIYQTEDTTDISDAVEAHVQEHEGPCLERGCRKGPHRA